VESTVSNRQQLALEVRSGDDGVLWLAGELDMAQAIRFTGAALAALDAQRGPHNVILDLSELRFLDSTGLRAIFQLATLTKGDVVLRNPRGNVAQLLDIAGVDRPMDVRIEHSRD
jgi:anti-anti-sigma factor